MQRIEGIPISLYPHQVKSVYDLEKLENEKKINVANDPYNPGNLYTIDTNIGIFGDMPGYGKTLSILSLIARDKMQWNADEPFIEDLIENFGNFSTYVFKRKISYTRLNCNLIIVPSSIVGQWEKEISKFNLTYTKITRNEHIHKLVHDDDVENYDIVLCSTTRYNEFIIHFQNNAWKRFIYDEPVSAIIPSMKEVFAGFSWYITATYNNLKYINKRKNYLSDVFCGMSQLVFDSILVKNNDDYVKMSFEMPPPIVYHHECINPMIYNVIQDVIGKNITEMLSAGDVQGAIRSLGGTKSNQNIVELVTENKKQELKEAEYKVEKHKIYKDRGNTYMERFEKWEKRVDDLKRQIENLETRFKKILEEPCPICYEDLQNPTMVSCCQNIYCGKCLIDWLVNKPTCPMCRSQVDKKGLITIDQKKQVKISFEGLEEKDEKEYIEYTEKKSKPDTILDIISKNEEEGRFLIFSSYDQSFDIVKRALEQKHIEYLEIKGTQETRENNLRKYISGEVNVILLNSKFNGAGINLQNTTDIIMYHSMPDHIERQVIGRANRIGRKKRLAIHYLD